MLEIGLIGVGVVGSALEKSFKEKNIKIKSFDKYKNIGTFDDILTTDIVFLVLPTLYNFDINEYDKQPIYETCEKLSNNKYNGIVILKSTVEPETTEFLENKYKLQIFHNPEFLSAKSAYEDFHNQKHIVIGKTLNSTAYNINLLENFFKKYYPFAKISICNSNESELMKLGVNNFYSVKIQFFTELYLLSKKIKNVDYNNIKNLMLSNNWIHTMHTNVPGSDGKLSYGGMCFPKDTNALFNYMKNKNTQYKIIEATINERNEIRNN